MAAPQPAKVVARAPTLPAESGARRPTPAQSETEAQLQQYIPRELLKKLDAARVNGEMVGERRIVTMLFCDVKGSTSAAEQLDPEDWTEIINGAFEHMIRPVYKYEGTLARLMGDAILAFFGAPIGHEDDPQRAVLAGLDIVAAIRPYCEQIKSKWGIDINVRVGINTGLVVVGAVGSDLRMEYTALGDAINLAARMEQTAVPGTVRIAHDTYKLIKALFEFEELGGVEVKGKSEPVLAYRVLARRAAGARTRGIEGMSVEMVGRDTEMAALRRVTADLEHGVGRIVCVLGDAGLGKSRLVSEVGAVFHVEARAPGEWHETSSLSYETNQAYGLFQRLILRMNGIAYDDPPPIVRQKLMPIAESLPEGSRQGATRALETLFGLASMDGAPPLDGEAFKLELFEAMSGWWRARFGNRPAILVFDDMHWSDAASIELLLRLLPLTGEIPLVLMCVMRSERSAPAWRIKTAAADEFHHRYTEIILTPLSSAESNELVNRLLAIADLPDRLRANILEKSGGNPFFIEEVVRTLIDSRIVVPEERSANGVSRRYWRAANATADFEIPDNLQSLLAARIDRLDDKARSILQLASVIGRSFYHRVLMMIEEAGPELDRQLMTLLRLDLIREAARVPEIEYAFLNPLTQETIYNTILLRRRRDFHRRIGEAMEIIHANRPESVFGLMAHHFGLAGQRDKSIEYSRRASQQSIALYAYDDAIQNLRSAIGQIPQAERSVIHLTLHEELGDAYRLLRSGAQALAHYVTAIAQWRMVKDADRITVVRLHRKVIQTVSELKWAVSLQDLQQANESRLASRLGLIEALPSLASAPPHLETVRVFVALSMDAWRMEDPPDWESAQRHAQAGVDMAERLDSPLDLSQALGALATVLDGRSLLRDHLAVAEKRLTLCLQPNFDDARERVEAHRSAGAARMYVGQYIEAVPYLREAEALALKVHAIDQQANALGMQAQCWLRLDRWDEVLSTEDQWRELEKRYLRERVGET